jgi:hypothetical protein
MIVEEGRTVVGQTRHLFLFDLSHESLSKIAYFRDRGLVWPLAGTETTPQYRERLASPSRRRREPGTALTRRTMPYRSCRMVWYLELVS